MNLIIEHLEYLLRRHDCVTVPGIGALMVRYRPARFDSRNPLVLLPPSRELVFNGALVEPDGILETSVSRRNGVSFEVAARIVMEEAESLSHQLKDFGSLVLGHLGELIYTGYDTIMFSPAKVSGWDCDYYGLQPLFLKNAENVVRVTSVDTAAVAPIVSQDVARAQLAAPSLPQWSGDSADDDPRQGHTHGRVARTLIGIAASLAVIVTVALFFLNPIKVDNEPLKASIAPVNETPARQVGNVEAVHVNKPMLSTEEPVADPVIGPPSRNVETSKTQSESGTYLADTYARAAEGDNDDICSTVAPRFNDADPYCVVVASFPEESQASRYLSENRGQTLGVLQQDGKYRVYAATGATYEEATAQKQLASVSGAWICRR